MAGFIQRLFGSTRPTRDYHAGPALAGLDPITARAIAIQRDYWRAAPDELASLEAEGFAALDWPAKLRAHHLRCLALLDAAAGHATEHATEPGALRRALLAPVDERPDAPGEPDPDALARVHSSARALVSRRSPYRPRHGFAWIGAGPPAGEAIPYSEFQGRTVNASLSHLGSVELIRLDAKLEPARLEFMALDEIMTISRGQLDDPERPPPFVPAQILPEYGGEPIVALLPTRYGLSWLSHEPAVLRGAATAGHQVASLELAGLADPTKAVANPHDRRALSLRIGAQVMQILSDYANEGLGQFEVGAAYQLSLAIDQDDPRFIDKCAGRGLDPDATRGDVVHESRLRASARAAKRRS